MSPSVRVSTGMCSRMTSLRPSGGRTTFFNKQANSLSQMQRKLAASQVITEATNSRRFVTEGELTEFHSKYGQYWDYLKVAYRPNRGTTAPGTFLKRHPDFGVSIDAETAKPPEIAPY